jgi:hypothetical protein
MSKLLSGRYILTLAAAFVFLWLSCKGMIASSDAMQVITMVFVLYFSRNDRQQSNQGEVK